MSKRRSSSVSFHSSVVAVTRTPRSRRKGITDQPNESSRPESERKVHRISWVDCPSCYGFGTTKMEWGEWYQTCLDCNGNGLLEAEPDEDEQPQT